MVQKLDMHRGAARPQLPPELELRGWRDEDLNAAGRLISEAYADHPDSMINDQYRSANGSMRFLHNIVRYAGCGSFSPQVSHIVIERGTREMVGLVLGSRVSERSGHITQLCVRPKYRRRGLGRMLLNVASGAFLRLGMSEVSLTVTEANSKAIELYRAEEFDCRHMFDAAVWRREHRA
jgi:ribosomal protein S18 acetylase RimI-like enzyme